MRSCPSWKKIVCMNNSPNPWLQGDYTPDHLVEMEPILHPASASVRLPVTTVAPSPGRPATMCNTWKGSLQTDSSAPPSVSRLWMWFTGDTAPLYFQTPGHTCLLLFIFSAWRVCGTSMTFELSTYKWRGWEHRKHSLLLPNAHPMVPIMLLWTWEML